MRPLSPAQVRWFRGAAWVGGATLAYSVLLQLVFPREMGPAPPGMRTPVLALELARTHAEMETLFGIPGTAERAEWVHAVNLGSALDFGFLVLYTAQLALLCRAARAVPTFASWSGVALALIAGIADAVENVSLLHITAALGTNYEGTLTVLFASTWIKWGSLALALASCAWPLARRGLAGKVFAVCSAAAVVLTPLAAVLRGAYAEGMLFAITASFVSAWAVSLGAARQVGN